MTDYDKKYFICNPNVVNWEQYYIVYVLGARIHLLRDPLKTYKAACIRAKRLKILHYFIKWLFICLALFIFISIVF